LVWQGQYDPLLETAHLGILNSPATWTAARIEIPLAKPFSARHWALSIQPWDGSNGPMRPGSSWPIARTSGQATTKCRF
jgi:hypothetical protein